MRENLVSAIIPIYNRSLLLSHAVTSVVSQTYSPFEILIVDDGSTDDTAVAAERLAAADPDRVRVFHQANAGPGAARNLGLQHARGEFIQYLDSDDLLRPRKFELQVAALRRHPEAGVCYGVTLRGDPAKDDLRVWARTGEKIERMFPDFLMQRGWATLTPLWRRSACEQIGRWADFRVLEDWDHDLRAGMLGIRPVRVDSDEPLAIVRDHGGDRASGMNTGFTPELTRDYFRAHQSVFRRMQELGLVEDLGMPEFTRKLFWLARMCGQHRLIDEAEVALEMTIASTGAQRAPREIVLFRTLTRVLGWHATVAIGERLRTCWPGRRVRSS